MKTKLTEQGKLVRNGWIQAAVLLLCLGAGHDALAVSPYAGVYSGPFSGGDSGIFTAFVGDDGASVLLSYSQVHSEGFYYTFTVNQNGGFSFTSGDSTTTGTISGNNVSGTFSSSGGSGTFSGTKRSSTGIQQANAGLYEGTIAGSASGPIKIILAADGWAASYVAPNMSSSADGGTGSCNAGGSFSTTTVQGVAVNGSVNSTTHVISGTWVGNIESGTFSATRTRTFTAFTTPWPDAMDLGGGWRRSSWFGDFNVTYYPWIYHPQHGWMYTFGTDPASIWLWTTDMGFVWTGSGVYPWLWSDTEHTWLYYAKGSQSPRWFFNWNTQTWESHNP